MSLLETEIQGNVALLRINRPEKRNALTLAMWRDLATSCRSLAQNADIRAVVLAGAGGSFSAGSDISEFGRLRATPEDALAYEHAVDDAADAISAFAKPTIAAIDGICIGGGCGIALACDFRWAGPTAQFAITAARMGLVYGVRETQNLLHAVGLVAAKRILFSAARLDAAEAYRIGLVDQVTPESAIPAALEFAGILAANAPLSMAGAKQMLQDLARGGNGQGAELRALMARAIASDDYREGQRAFAERRAPRFTGH